MYIFINVLSSDFFQIPGKDGDSIWLLLMFVPKSNQLLSLCLMNNKVIMLHGDYEKWIKLNGKLKSRTVQNLAHFWAYTQGVIRKPLYLENNFETEYTDIFPGSSITSESTLVFEDLKINYFFFFWLMENSPKALTKGLLFCRDFSFCSLFYGSL